VGLGNLPPGVTDRDCGIYLNEHFDFCPECDAEVGDEIWCQACGAVLDEQEAAAEDRFEAEEANWRDQW
jgi:hypothetical protein